MGKSNINQYTNLGLSEKEGVFSLKEAVGPYFYKFTQKILLTIAYLFSFFFVELNIKGSENVKKIPKGGVLIIANHKGYFDPLFMGIALPNFSRINPLRFMAKDDFFKNFFSYFVYKNLLGSYPSFYGQGIDKSLEIPRKILRRGGTVVFFPEGKCFIEKGIAPFKPGASILASSFPNIPILPISIYGGHQISKRVATFHRPKITINIGQYFTLAEKLAADPDANASDILRNEVQQLYSERF